MANYDEPMNYSQDDLDQMFQAGVAPEQLQILLEKLRNSRKIVNREGPQMREAGRMTFAASPLEFLGDIYQKRKAKKEVSSAEASMNDVISGLRRGRQLYTTGPEKPLVSGPTEEQLQADQPPVESLTNPAPDISMLSQALRKKKKLTVDDPNFLKSLMGGGTGNGSY